MRPVDNAPLDRRAALTNLGLAAGVALLVWLAWWIWQDPAPPVARQRGLTDVELTWRCEGGHEFAAQGACGTRQCPECGRRAHLVHRYWCVEHGELIAELHYQPDANGQPALVEVWFDDGTVLNNPTTVTCPICGRDLQSVRPSLFPSSKTTQDE